MAVTKRNTNKEEKKEDITETKVSSSTTTPPTKNVEETPKASCACRGGCGCLKNLVTFVLTVLAVVGGSILYVKQFQPELYNKRLAVFFPQSSSSASTPVTTPVVAETRDATPDTGKAEADEKDDTKKIKLEDYEDVINLEERAFLKNALEEERIKEKLKDRPDLLKVKDYMEEPIGQLVKRFSLEQQVVLFINSNDERSKVTRLAISQAKVPFGIMEVDNEPRRGEIRSALFRMTAQRTFPFIFVNGKFFGNSFALQKAMQDGSFYEMVDSEENKKAWLADKEEYAKKIEKRKRDKEERERKKLEKIKEKIQEKQHEAEL